MNRQLHISILWFLIAVGYIYHSTYHLSGAIFGIDIKMPDATGQVPVVMYVFRIVLEVLTLALVLLTLYITARAFYWFSFIWAIILGLMNVAHLAETVMSMPGELSQLALLTFILAVNVLLIAETRKQTRTSPSMT